MAVAPDGSIYVGSGNEGKVFKIDSAGKIATFFDTTELEVHALALAPDGSLYAATSPDGRIYKIDRSGKGGPFFDPEDKYIWSLALDGQGNVYAGTGEKGPDLQNHPGRQGQPVLRDEGHPRHRAHRSSAMASCWPAPRGPDDCSASINRARRSSCSIRRIRRFARSDSIRRATSTRRLSGRTSSTSQPPPTTPSEPAPPSTREPVPTVTTEVTAIAVVDSGGASVGSADAPAREDSEAGAARFIASSPTVSGTSCGSPRTIHPTTSRSTARAP
jgi:hypothetical protein